MNKRPVVIKVGGSLLALKRLNEELAELIQTVKNHQVVLLTGGGPAVKAYRKLCEASGIPQERAHWHCIQLMCDLTNTLCDTFPNSVAVSSWNEAELAWKSDRIPWFIVESFLRSDDKQRDHLPHTWDVSSDSIAAHLAIRHEAELILLKGCALPKRRVTAKALAKRGIVDKWFPRTVTRHFGWSVRNLPGGTVEEIALVLLEPSKPVPRRRKPRPAPLPRPAKRPAAKRKRPAK